MAGNRSEEKVGKGEAEDGWTGGWKVLQGNRSPEEVEKKMNNGLIKGWKL